MIKSVKELDCDRISIRLDGPDGNAFCLLGYAKKFADQAGLDWESLRVEMTSDDYEHLVDTFDKHFGDFVILYR